MEDGTSAFLAFGAILAGFGLYLAWLHRVAARIEARLDRLEGRGGRT